ncbi:unnamed protein product [Allacma fusca]|uniref:Bcl-2 Bcl-2 homology region 1-3 domain-containing protein n=1 Tax=Allacma fusca TaxID=39272 RepID=A0A8J2K9B4_9HEXA|nr:unnamed protein product [Allacma fusca]
MNQESISVQTDDEEVDDLTIALGQLRTSNGYYFHEKADPEKFEGGFIALLSRFLFPPDPPLAEAEENEEAVDQKNNFAQTEFEPQFAKTVQLTYLLLQDLGLSQSIPSDLKDEAYQSLSHAVTLMMVRQSTLLNGMVNRLKLMDYRLFPSLADEIFELNADNPTGELRINWGRIVALYAFAVKLSQENRNHPERVDLVTKLLSNYMTEHVHGFLRSNGGWDGLVGIFPPPVNTGAVMKNLFIFWSGLRPNNSKQLPTFLALINYNLPCIWRLNSFGYRFKSHFWRIFRHIFIRFRLVFWCHLVFIIYLK